MWFENDEIQDPKRFSTPLSGVRLAAHQGIFSA
jgi:hypothetical protein